MDTGCLLRASSLARTSSAATQPGAAVREKRSSRKVPNSCNNWCAYPRCTRTPWCADPRRLHLPTEIVEADRWVQQHLRLKGGSSWPAVDQHPGIAASRRSRISLRPGKHGQEPLLGVGTGRRLREPKQAVLDAVQTNAQRAEQAGNLRSTPQRTSPRRARRS